MACLDKIAAKITNGSLWSNRTPINNHIHVIACTGLIPKQAVIEFAVIHKVALFIAMHRHVMKVQEMTQPEGDTGVLGLVRCRMPFSANT